MAGREADKAGMEPVAAVPAVTLAGITAMAAPHHLAVLGGFTCQDDPGLPAGTRSLLLLGPAEPGYWAHVTAQPEWCAPDPIDRWSRRVIGGMACDLGAKAIFPFGGPPYHPFYQWALRTGRVWDSPVRLLVQAEQGLMVSFRGALALKEVVEVPGDHDSMVLEPNVRRLAARLRSVIMLAEAGGAGQGLGRVLPFATAAE